MSRIGALPIPIPAGVDITIQGSEVTVRGPRGELRRQLAPGMRVAIDEGTLVVSRPSDARSHRALHGLSRSLLANMVAGVSQGFQKTLELSGVGYRAAKVGDKLVLQLGFSRPAEVVPP